MKTYKALWVEETGNGLKQSIVSRPLTSLPDNDVLIRVNYSSLNFKDAMSFHGNKAVTREFPHQPGIDAAGIVKRSTASAFKPGDEVIVTGFDLGMNTAGGLAEYIAVPAQWVVAKPSKLSLKTSMQFGTAGLTAALCIDKLLTMGITPEDGDILVTGATGGVGSLAVALLASSGFSVTACSGKTDVESRLLSIGARKVLPRSMLLQETNKPLLKGIYSGAIDVAGGNVLTNVLKQIKPSGSVACCGLVASPNLNTTVLPFILRGVNLLGIDSVEIPISKKQQIWEKLASYSITDQLNTINACIKLADCPDYLKRLYKGGIQGHIMVDLT